MIFAEIHGVLCRKDADKWELSAMSVLREICSKSNKKVILLEEEVLRGTLEEACEMAKEEEWLVHSLEGVIPLEEGKTKEDRIQAYLEENSLESGYLVLSAEQVNGKLRGRSICTRKHGILTEQDIKTAVRLLEYGPWWSDEYIDKVEDIERTRRMRDGYEKVIFLDVDGVLNDNSYDCAISEEFVKNLGWIVEQTGAEIILSSSWRRAYGGWGYGGFRGERPKVEDLLTKLEKYDLRIAGATPLYFNGPDGRPFEIRSWLCQRPSIKAFVVLDDETFWSWGWMKSFVVTTCRKEGREEKLGLDFAFAEQAVRILNGKV